MKIFEFLRLPSMTGSALVAGNTEALYKEIVRLDILESPHPFVEIFLEKDEFILTSFFISKDDKQARINLVRSMIDNNCAGLGIMPDLYLNNEIDGEIIEIANQASFPIILIPDSCRWSEILKDYYKESVLNSSEHINANYFSVSAISFRKFEKDRNHQELIDQLSKVFNTPMIIVDSEIYTSGFHNIEIHNIYMRVKANISSKGLITSSFEIIEYESKLCYLVGYSANNKAIFALFKPHNRSSIAENYFRDISYYFLEMDTNNLDQKEDLSKKFTSSYYFVYYVGDKINITGENRIHEIKNKVSVNAQIFLFDILITDITTLYQEIGKLSNRKETFEYLIYCPIEMDLEDVLVTVETLSEVDFLRKVGLKKEIFSLAEIMLINQLRHSDYYIVECQKNLLEKYFDSKASKEEKDTMRHYIMLRSINQTADLLEVHPNTVKYRISNVVNEEKFYRNSISDNYAKFELLINLLIEKSNIL